MCLGIKWKLKPKSKADFLFCVNKEKVKRNKRTTPVRWPVNTWRPQSTELFVLIYHRILRDRKGSCQICAWGLPSVSHEKSLLELLSVLKNVRGTN